MKKTLTYYKIYSFYSSLLFFLPVLLTIYTSRGIADEKVLLIEACYNFTIFMFEVPTGYLADKFGHDKSVLIGLTGTIISYIIFAFSMDLTCMIISQVLLAFFSTFISGSDLGSLATFMEESNEIDTLSIQKDIYFIRTFAKLLSFIASGFILKLDNKGIIIFVSTAIIYFISAIFYKLFVHSKKEYAIDEKVKIENKEEIKYEKNNNKITFTALKEILICGVLLGIVSAIYLISQVYYKEMNVETEFLGLIYCLSSILTMIFVKTELKFNKKMVFFIPCIFLITVLKFKFIILLFITFGALIDSKVCPFINDYILMNVGENKAFSMSISSLISNLINSLVMLSLSGIMSKVGFDITMIIISCTTLIICIYIYMKSNLDHRYIEIK